MIPTVKQARYKTVDVVSESMLNNSPSLRADPPKGWRVLCWYTKCPGVLGYINQTSKDEEPLFGLPQPLDGFLYRKVFFRDSDDFVWECRSKAGGNPLDGTRKYRHREPPRPARLRDPRNPAKGGYMLPAHNVVDTNPVKVKCCLCNRFSLVDTSDVSC